MWTVHFEYDVMGRESLHRLLGGVESHTRYDRSGHVTDQVTQGVGYEVSHRSYDWDLSGKPRKLTAGSYTAEFDYDVVGTLAAARYNETGRNRKGLMQMFFFILLLNRMSLFENRIFFLYILIRFFLWIIKENRNFNSCEVPILVPYFCKVLIYR